MSAYQTAKDAVEAGRLFLVGASIIPYPMGSGFYVLCKFSAGEDLEICIARTDKTRVFKSLNSALLAVNALRGFAGREARSLEVHF